MAKGGGTAVLNHIIAYPKSTIAIFIRVGLTPLFKAAGPLDLLLHPVGFGTLNPVAGEDIFKSKFKGFGMGNDSFRLSRRLVATRSVWSIHSSL